MTKDETLLVFTLVVSSVSVFLFGILLFMVLISATRDFRERTKSKLVKIMIWASIVVITFYDKLPWIWEVSLSRYWDRLIDFLDRYLWACAQRIQTGIRKQKGEFVVTFSCRVKPFFLRESNRGWDTSISSEQPLSFGFLRPPFPCSRLPSALGSLLSPSRGF